MTYNLFKIYHRPLNQPVYNIIDRQSNEKNINIIYSNILFIDPNITTLFTPFISRFTLHTIKPRNYVTNYKYHINYHELAQNIQLYSLFHKTTFITHHCNSILVTVTMLYLRKHRILYIGFKVGSPNGSKGCTTIKFMGVVQCR